MIPNIIVISGASRGFGQASAIALSAAFPQASFHLHASSAKSLESTQALLPGSTSFKLHGIDLAKLAAGDSEALKAAKSLQEAIQSDVAGTKAAGEQGKVLFVHSAAILGPTGPLEGILGDKPESEAFALFTQAAQVNVAGSLAFASLVAKCTNPAQDLACINVSTKCAVLPGAFDLFDVYSITKSAAHFMFASLASRGVKVLQYCPGPMRTDMTYEQHGLDWPWVDPLDSARAMVTTFVEGRFESGAVVDYLDDGLAAKYSGGQEASAVVAEEGKKAASAPAAVASAASRPHRCVITRIESFCASHTLENCSWCDDKNKEVFGKCNNLHGHNYKVEFSFAGSIDKDTGMVVNISDVKVILQEFLGRLDHSHLNDHQDIFKGAPTTAEVISQVLFEQVGVKVQASGLPTQLVKVKVWETDKNIAEFGEI